ncbi:Spx/MgsR family RNA polymerase-binding regulatory protein [Luteolibacter algae]|uniref:Spx/MgsR family RNA polymerase-binding regulatory protein n=1 Tax=Luteolibacter algae TaxID=454151 RepID=A0ABW5D5Y2_9BACT
MKIYTLKTCDSCRKATKWLKEQGISFEEIAIRATPPSDSELQTALKNLNGDIKKLFNTSGQDYRVLNLKEKLPGLPEADALQLLAANGNLIKRPFLISGGKTLVGFKPDLWKSQLTEA